MTPFHVPRGFIAVTDAETGLEKLIQTAQIKTISDLGKGVTLGPDVAPVRSRIELVERRAGVANEKIFTNDDLATLALFISRSKG